MTISTGRLDELLGRFSSQRILVVGDHMVDKYIHGSVTRICPEAPVPVVRVNREREVPGGASNVALNINTLEAKAEACGITGADAQGEQLRSMLTTVGVGVEGLVAFEEIQTTMKARIVAEQQQVVRVDWDQDTPFTDSMLATFCTKVEEEVGKSTGVVIEDYGRGVVEQPVVDAVLRAARTKGIPVGYDPKDNHSLDVRGVTVATPNRVESFLAAGSTEREARLPNPDNATLEKVGAKLLSAWGPTYLMMTLGSEGMLLMGEGMEPYHMPTRAQEVFDVSGAGDTVVGTCVLAMAAGATFLEAADLANHAAGVVVGKFGTATCSQVELRQAYAS